MIQPASIQVRFSDLDIMGHVTNSVYLQYWEITRVHYFKELLGEDWDWRKNGTIVAKNVVEYIQPIFLKDNPIIHMTCTHIGTKSCTVNYKVFVGEQLKTTGETILVAYNAIEHKSINLPEEIKNALEKIKEE